MFFHGFACAKMEVNEVLRLFATEFTQNHPSRAGRGSSMA